MSGNSEKFLNLEGAINCPSCGFISRRGEPQIERAFYVLRDADGSSLGYLNGKIGLEKYGGIYSEIIEFKNDSHGTDKDKIVRNVAYLTCDLCLYRFDKDHKLFKFFLFAYENGRWTVPEE